MSYFLDQYPGPSDPSGQAFGISRLEWAVDQLAHPDFYLGQIGTRCFLVNGPSASVLQANARTEHFARSTVDDLQIMVANVYGAAGAETGPGAPSTVSASIEYIDGTIKPFTFGQGASHVVVPDKGMALSDPISGRVSDGMPFFIRQYRTNPSQGIYDAISGGPNDKFEYGTSGITDKTLGGTIPNTTPGSPFCMPPIAIIGKTRNVSVFLAGDSLTKGVSDRVSNAWQDMGITARSIGPQLAYINTGINSDTLINANNPANYVNRQLLSQYCSHIIDAYGINDIVGGQTAAQVAANRTVFAAKFGGKRVYGTSLGPDATSTDGWVTLANQTPFAQNAARVAFNGLVRAGIVGEFGYFDVADALESDRNSGIWAVGYLPGAASGIANTSDQPHPNIAGNERVACMQVINPGVLQR